LLVEQPTPLLAEFNSDTVICASIPNGRSRPTTS
jgi:hypothetical protein